MVDTNRNGTQTSDSMLDTIKAQLHAKIEPTEKLGAYIRGVLLNRQWTLEELAEKLGHETTLFLRALIQGQMPEEAIDDEFIEKLGQVIERSPNVIRVILGRKPKEGTQIDSLLAEQAEQSEAMIETLLAVIPQRYDKEITGDMRRSKQFDFVIRQLEKFIARQKQELEMATRLVQQLQNDDPTESMKLDVRRIISKIMESEAAANSQQQHELHEALLVTERLTNNRPKP